MGPHHLGGDSDPRRNGALDQEQLSFELRSTAEVSSFVRGSRPWAKCAGRRSFRILNVAAAQGERWPFTPSQSQEGHGRMDSGSHLLIDCGGENRCCCNRDLHSANQQFRGTRRVRSPLLSCQQRQGLQACSLLQICGACQPTWWRHFIANPIIARDIVQL